MNKYDKIFDWYTIDEAFEICKGKVMIQIERKLDHDEKMFMDNVIEPFDERQNKARSKEERLDYVMKTPFLRGIFNFAKAVRELNSENVNPN